MPAEACANPESLVQVESILSRLQDGLIVSCQPVPGSPLERTDYVVALAQAVISAGAVGLRIEGIERVAAVCAAVDVPVIGIVKFDMDETPVRITPLLEHVDQLAAAGAEIIAFDATDRVRPVTVEALIQRVHSHGRLAMADTAFAAEGHRAAELGADIVASTLSGYGEGEAEPTSPDLGLISALSAAGHWVIAEGNVRRPEDAAAARKAGANAVVVGSAITRPEHVTGWFLEAIGARKA